MHRLTTPRCCEICGAPLDEETIDEMAEAYAEEKRVFGFNSSEEGRAYACDECHALFVAWYEQHKDDPEMRTIREQLMAERKPS